MYNKIPPPFITLAFALSTYFTKPFFPNVLFPFYECISILFFSLGLIFLFSSAILFKKKSTTLNPLHPDKATTLVTTGFFKFSRNPMYLGMLLILIALTIRFNMLGGALSCIIFIFYMNKFQIAPEEKAMEKIFAEEFIIYKNKTRRWL